MRYNDSFENIKKLTEDDVIVSEAQKTITPPDEGEMIDAIEWTDDTQKCLRVKIVNQEDYWRYFWSHRSVFLLYRDPIISSSPATASSYPVNTIPANPSFLALRTFSSVSSINTHSSAFRSYRLKSNL